MSAVVTCSTQFFARSESRAFNWAIARFARLRRLLGFAVPWRRASCRWRWDSRARSGFERVGQRRKAPSLVATVFTTPLSIPTHLPVAARSIGIGLTVKATCQRPARSRVTRYDLAASARLVQRNRTHPSLGTSTSPQCRLSRRTWLAETATTRNPSWTSFFRQVGYPWLPA